MIELSFGQKYDDNGMIMPWLSHGALDEIKSMDLSDKNVLMYGAGLGSGTKQTIFTPNLCQHHEIIGKK